MNWNPGSRILCTNSSSTIPSLFWFAWNPVPETSTNLKHKAVSKLLLYKCSLFYSFRNNQPRESCLFQGFYAYIKFISLLNCLLRVMQSYATFSWQTNHRMSSPALSFGLFSPQDYRIITEQIIFILLYNCVQTHSLIVLMRCLPQCLEITFVYASIQFLIFTCHFDSCCDTSYFIVCS